MKVFVVLALCLCTVSAGFLSGLGSSSERSSASGSGSGSGLFSSLGNLGNLFGSGSQTNQKRVIKLTNIDGSVAGPYHTVFSRQPDEIVKVIHYGGNSGSANGGYAAAPVIAAAGSPNTIKIIKIVEGANPGHAPSSVYGPPAVQAPSSVYGPPAVHAPSPIYGAPESSSFLSSEPIHVPEQAQPQAPTQIIKIIHHEAPSSGYEPAASSGWQPSSDSFGSGSKSSWKSSW